MTTLTATTTVKVGYPDRGLTLRWGEKHKVLIESPSWTSPVRVHLWMELLVGNISGVERSVQVVVEVGARRVVKTVMVPPKGKTALNTSYNYPENAPPFYSDDAKQHREMGAMRRFTAPDPARGEAAVWIDLGAVTLGVALWVKAATLPEGPKLEAIDAMPWAFGDTFTMTEAKSKADPAAPPAEVWSESARTHKTEKWGDRAVEYPDTVLMKDPSKSGEKKLLAFAAPLSPKEKDPLGAGFVKRAVFTPLTYSLETLNLPDAGGAIAKRFGTVVWVSPDGTREIELVMPVVTA